ncbi:MAG: hypothetical protein AAGB24_00990 [Bacteroidota bacterium]
MQTHADKNQENKSQSVANAVSQKKVGGESTFQFVDNRPVAITQRKLQELANHSPQVQQLSAIQNMAAANSVAQKKSNVKQRFDFLDNRPEAITQRKLQEMVNKSSQAKQATPFNPIDISNTNKELSLSAGFKSTIEQNRNPQTVLQPKWIDDGDIRLKWTPKINGFNWFFDQGMNKFIYTLDSPHEFDEQIVKHQKIPLSEEELDQLGFDELEGQTVDPTIELTPFSEGAFKSVQERAKAHQDYHTAREKGVELWMELQTALTNPSDTTELDQRFKDHYFTDMDSSEFDGQFKEQDLNDDQYVAWSWGYVNPDAKPEPQGKEEQQDAYDERIGKQGKAHYENYFDLGENGEIVAESNWRDKDKESGAKDKSIPNNIMLWKQYELAAKNRELRGVGSEASAYENLKLITRHNIANSETVNTVKMAYGANAKWDKDVVQFLPGSEQFFAIIGTPNCKSIVRMLNERVSKLKKTIEGVEVIPGDIGSVSIKIYLKDYH